MTSHIIKKVIPGSIAETLELARGDKLLSVNGEKIHDVFDYRFMTRDERLLLEVAKPDGDIWEVDIEKDEDEDLGIIFNKPLMDKAKTCRNHCAFCFIDQLPPDMRDALYVKDDDPRLSFLTGNYVTLTNLSPRDVRQVARYHLSPIRVSVHATDPDIRRKLLNNPNAGRLLKILQIWNEAGITLHFQVVLCRGINDGIVLDDTINTLLRFMPGAASLSVVPAGLTRYRDGLFPLQSFTADEAASVIRQINSWQQSCKDNYDTSFVYCADEFYIKAGLPLPTYKHYEDFPQLENGVGMIALFEHDFRRALARLQRKKTSVLAGGGTIGIVTGRAAGDFMRKLCAAFAEVYPTVNLRVYEIENAYFGPEITVSGLLTGRDIIAQINGSVKKDGVRTLLLPRNMFRADKAVTLDDLSTDDLSAALGTPVIIGSADGGRFCRKLFTLCNSLC